MSKDSNTFSFEKLEEKMQKETLEELEYFSVLEFIANKCLSEKGRELVKLALPQNDLSWLETEHSMIDEMVRLLISDEEIPFENISDIRSVLKKSKIENSVLNTGEILSILDVIRVAHNLKLFLTIRSDKYLLLNEEANLIFDDPILQKHILDAIDETGEIRDNATKELQRIRIEVAEKSNRLRSRMNRIVKQFSDENFTQEEFFTVRDGRFVLPIKAEYKRQITGIIHSVSQTGATVFLEPTEVIEMNNEISLLKVEEQREIYNILKRLTSEIAAQSSMLFETYEIVGHLDALYAKAQYALQFGGVKPLISEKNEIYISKIYHPLLVHSLGKKNVVPLSIDFSEEKRGHLISGPNAGGKTVALKSIGLNVLLALSGFFPLGEVHTNFRTVYSAIGDHQSIENNLSTFSSQLLKLKRILDVADSKSLVLIDEIGSGTDPQEGGALAAGILDTFIEVNLFFIATTHQSSLKTYALNREVIDNASLEFNENELKPTYKFLSGIPGNSYAFFLAQNMGVSSKVLKRARKYLGNKQKEIEQSIAILQKYHKAAEETLTAAQREKNKYEKLKNEVEERAKDLKIKRKEIIDKAKLEAYEILQNTNALSENILRELKEGKRNPKEVTADLNKKREKLGKEVQELKLARIDDAKKVKHLEIGDTVAMIENSQIGEVLEADNDAKIALIDFNGIKFRLSFEQLYYKDKDKTKKPKTYKKQSDIVDYLKLDVKTKLDLRGMRAEAALKEVADFIAQAIMGNADFVTIIHGKGTGALRQAIHEQLEYMGNIKSFRLGELVEGGAGVTIVNLR